MLTKPNLSNKKYCGTCKTALGIIEVASIIVNICVGGKAWSAIVVAGEIALWKLVFALDLVEYNRISQFIKATIYSCIILALIHFLIVPFWALGIISILVYAALIVSGILFLTDIKRQKQNG